MSGHKINFIYEIETPLGHLPMGYKHIDVPLIFSEINEKSTFEHECPVIYFGTEGYGSPFKKLQETNDFYSTLDNYVNKRLLGQLSDEEILNDVNLFVITPTHNQTITEKIHTENISDYFTKTTKSYLCTHKNFKIVFVDDKEGGLTYTKQFWENLRKASKELKLNEGQLIFITNTANIKEIYESYLEKYKINSFMKCSTIHFHVYNAPGNCILDYLGKSNSPNDLVDYNGVKYSIPYDSELNIKRSKYYLCMNRNSERMHRTNLVKDLIKNGMFDKGLISLFKSPRVDKECKTNKELNEFIGKTYPFTIDYEDSEFVSHLHNFFNTKESWMDTYFSVVNETTNSNKHIFITEKSIRPMIYFHPFIIHGDYGILQKIKDLGFKTFPEFFDESYDTIQDQDERRNFIVNEVKKLCDKPISEIHQLYQSVIPKLIHNRNLLVDMASNNTKFKKFYEQVS